MLQQLDSELEHHTETPLIVLGDFNARHHAWDQNIKDPTEMEKFWLISSADTT